MSEGESVFPRSFILRITKDEWYRRVFDIKKYYPGVPRKWEPGGTIFLVRKAEKGDSLVGYGIIEKFVKRDLLPEERRQECKTMGWMGEIGFGELYKFEPPLPIKETVLHGLGVRGRYFHGYPLTRDEIESILRTAKEKVALRKID